MVQEDINLEEFLSRMERNQEMQIDMLRKIKNWVAFFGILTILEMILASCNALMAIGSL